MRKKIIFGIIIAFVVLAIVVWRGFIKEKEPEFLLAKAEMGAVVREVSETGSVKISDKIELGFNNSGRLEKIYVETGYKVETGQKLAQLDASQLYIELSESQAALEVTQADYNKLLAGSSAEEIKIAETGVFNAQINLKTSRQNLKDVEAEAEEDLAQAYEDGLDVLDDGYLKIYNAYNVVSDVQRTYFTASDQEGSEAREKKQIIENALDQAEIYIEQAKNGSNEKIDNALVKIKNTLTDTIDALTVVRNMAETPLYRNQVSSSDKTSLDNQKSYVSTARTSIISSQQTISSTKISNETNINSAQADVSSKEAALQKAEDELALKKAGPTQENIDLYAAKINQAKAKVSLLNNKIQDSVLKSPASGQITEIKKKKGETVQASEPVISFLAQGPFQIEVDIYEEDIVEVKPGLTTRITLAAFPDKVFQGKVVSVDPAEKLIDNVVYYRVIIGLEGEAEGIKPGMTADIVVETAKKENVLTVPRGALTKKNGKTTVQVFENGKSQEQEVEVGLEGEDSAEILSGLSEGDQIILGGK